MSKIDFKANLATQIYKQCNDLVKYIQASDGLDLHQINDSVTNTTLRILNKIEDGTIKVDDDYSSYLFIVLKNELISHYQIAKYNKNIPHNNKIEIDPLYEDDMGYQFVAEEKPEEDDRMYQVNIAVKSLNNRDQKIYSLLLEGYSIDEIMKKLNTTRNIVDDVPGKIRAIIDKKINPPTAHGNTKEDDGWVNAELKKMLDDGLSYEDVMIKTGFSKHKIKYQTNPQYRLKMSKLVKQIKEKKNKTIKKI